MPYVILEDRYTGDLKPIALTLTYASGASKGSAIAISSGTAIILDPSRNNEVTGTADSGSATTFVDATLAGAAANLYVGCPVRITDASDGEYVDTWVSGYDTATGTFTVPTLPFTVAAGDTLRLLAYPVQAQAAVTVSGTGSNTATINAAAGAFEQAGPRIVLFRLTMSATWIEAIFCVLNILSR